MDALEAIKTLEALKANAEKFLGWCKPEHAQMQMLKWELDQMYDKLKKVKEDILIEQGKKDEVIAKANDIIAQAESRAKELEQLKRKELEEIRRKSSDLDLLIGSEKKKRHLAEVA